MELSRVSDGYNFSFLMNFVINIPGSFLSHPAPLLPGTYPRLSVRLPQVIWAAKTLPHSVCSLPFCFVLYPLVHF